MVGARSRRAVAALGTAAIVATALARGAGAAPQPAAVPACIPSPPSSLPNDPDRVAASLTGAAKAALAGYPGTVYRTPWDRFRPRHGPPWRIGMSNSAGNVNAEDIALGLEQEARLNPGLVSSIIFTTPRTPGDVATQIEQMRSLVRQHVDLIISTLGSSTALDPVIDEAAKQDVPVISLLGTTADRRAVDLEPNPIQLGYLGARGLMIAIGGKGRVLVVDGTPGLSLDANILRAATAVLRACHVDVVGTVDGNFDPAAARSAVLAFLATHPGSIQGVFQVSDMAAGVFSAFAAAGRVVPPVDDIGAPAASLAYWREHESSGYRGSGVGIPPIQDGQYAMAAGLAMLEGRDLKITAIPYRPPVITAANLSQWVEPGWTINTNALSDGPPGAIPIDQLLNSYFNRP